MLHLSRRITALFVLIAASLLSLPSPAAADDNMAGFFRYPTTDGSSVVFTSEGDLWRVPLKGGVAVRLTTHEGEERLAHFSPDGKWLCFSGQDDGQDDVYAMSANGGAPKRLTYHPEADQALGWDQQGNIIYRSRAETIYRGTKVYRINPAGGWPEALNIDKCAWISFEPGGKRVAMTRYPLEFRTWKRYQGGWAQDIWVGDIAKIEYKNITDNPPVNDFDGNDAFPMWHSDKRIYFLSDRDGRSNIFSMNSDGGDVKRHTNHKDFDVRWPSLGGGVIVYQNGMDVWSLDIKSGASAVVPIELPSDRVQAREKFVSPSDYISWFTISPDENRVLFCARGDLFTAPSSGQGLIRQLTFSSNSAEKYAEWAPDGKNIAAWSDASGEEQLYLYPFEGGAPKLIGVDKGKWHWAPLWSPDGKSVAYGNELFELVVQDVATGATKVVDKGNWEMKDYSWSGDSRFLAFSRTETNYNNSLQIWDAKAGKVFQVEDAYYNHSNPRFDPEGKYLFFLSNRVANPHLDPQEYTYILDKRTKIYAVSLIKGTLLPQAPKADPDKDDEKKEDDDKAKDDKKDKKDKKGDKDEEKTEKPVDVVIDFDGLGSRIAPLKIPAGNYYGMSVVKGKIFYVSAENEGILGDDLFQDDEGAGSTLHRYDIKEDEDEVVVSNVRGYEVSAKREKLIIRNKAGFYVIGVDEKLGGEEDEKKLVNLGSWSLRVDQRAEWGQMFREAWRLQRDFFWEPGMHGVDWEATYKQYSALAPRISSRDELNDLIGEMLSELNCSHTYVWGGGDVRHADRHNTGLLGVDVNRHASGFYKIERVIAGRAWEPNSSSPLAAPGIDAKVGEYIVAVNGRSTASVANYLELLLETAGEVTAVTLNSTPSLDGGREVIVKPLASERVLRYNDWVDGRKAYVEQKSGGKLGYIHLTNMGSQGLSQFTEAYQPQHNRQGLIMDVRYNGGGFVADMILPHLGRKPFTFGRSRHGLKYRSPSTAFYGHMAALCNGETGSDGETFTEGFKDLGLGPVIGQRTWGGWVGIRGDKAFMDNGMTTQPEFTGYNLRGEWMIEGWGTEPDIEIKEDPDSYTRGEDPQLDKAISYLLDKITSDPKVIPQEPAHPDRRLKMKF